MRLLPAFTSHRLGLRRGQRLSAHASVCCYRTSTRRWWGVRRSCWIARRFWNMKTCSCRLNRRRLVNIYRSTTSRGLSWRTGPSRKTGSCADEFDFIWLNPLVRLEQSAADECNIYLRHIDRQFWTNHHLVMNQYILMSTMPRHATSGYCSF